MINKQEVFTNLLHSFNLFQVITLSSFLRQKLRAIRQSGSQLSHNTKSGTPSALTVSLNGFEYSEDMDNRHKNPIIQIPTVFILL